MTPSQIETTVLRLEAIDHLKAYCPGEQFYLSGDEAIGCANPRKATRLKIMAMDLAGDLSAIEELDSRQVMLFVDKDLSGLKNRAEGEAARKSNLAASLPLLNQALTAVGMSLKFDGDFLTAQIPEEGAPFLTTILLNFHGDKGLSEYFVTGSDSSLRILSTDPERLAAAPAIDVAQIGSRQRSVQPKSQPAK